MSEIRIESISKTYPGKNRSVTALLPVNLTVNDGEFLTILGPSGCGKTTLLSIIVGIIPPTSGRIILDNSDITYLDPRERDMAMVFQNYALYPSKTVRGNMEFPLRMRGMAGPERRRRVDELAQVLGLSSLLDQHPRQLSGGQQQRVALGRAMIRQPKVFLMDEPLSNLDAKLRLQMRTEIKRLHRQFPITTMYVTHGQSEAMTLSDRVAVMNHGVVVQVGTPEEVYRQPANLFVAEFVGMPTMNFLPITLSSTGQGVECRLETGTVVARVPSLPDVPPSAVLGIRPANLRWRDRGEGARAVVTEVDLQGEDALIHAQVAGKAVTLIAREERLPKVDDEIILVFPPTSIHLFDVESGLALSHPQNVVDATPAALA